VTLPAVMAIAVGSMTHGLKTMQDCGNADVAALLASGWVTMEMVRRFRWCIENHSASPMGRWQTPVLIRTSCSYADPAVRSCRCHATGFAWGANRSVISSPCQRTAGGRRNVGCMLSRVRTLANSQMTCAIPPPLPEVVERCRRPCGRYSGGGVALRMAGGLLVLRTAIAPPVWAGWISLLAMYALTTPTSSQRAL